MLLGDIINAVIAIAAFIGILVSMRFNRTALKQAKELALFERRYTLIQYFLRLFGGNWLVKPDSATREELYVNHMCLPYLFDDCKIITEVTMALLRYYIHDVPFEDFSNKYKGDTKYEYGSDIENALFNYAFEGIRVLQKQLYSSEPTKKRKGKMR